MKHYIRPTSRTGRMVTRLNRSFSTAEAAKAALRDWLKETNAQRRKKDLDPLRVSHFKIVSIAPHPYAPCTR